MLKIHPLCLESLIFLFPLQTKVSLTQSHSLSGSEKWRERRRRRIDEEKEEERERKEASIGSFLMSNLLRQQFSLLSVPSFFLLFFFYFFLPKCWLCFFGSRTHNFITFSPLSLFFSTFLSLSLPFFLPLSFFSLRVSSKLQGWDWNIFRSYTFIPERKKRKRGRKREEEKEKDEEKKQRKKKERKKSDQTMVTWRVLPRFIPLNLFTFFFFSLFLFLSLPRKKERKRGKERNKGNERECETERNERKESKRKREATYGEKYFRRKNIRKIHFSGKGFFNYISIHFSSSSSCLISFFLFPFLSLSLSLSLNSFIFISKSISKIRTISEQTLKLNLESSKF